MTINETIAGNIRFLRRSHNYTRLQFAVLIEVTTAAFASYLDERAIPRMETLCKICDYFRITLDELVRTDLSKCYVIREEKYLERIEPKLTIEK